MGLIFLHDLSKASANRIALIGIAAFSTHILSTVLVQRVYLRLLAYNNGSMVLPTTQVNSTIGVFIYGVLGQFSLVNCAFVAISISLLTFLAFSISRVSKKKLFAVRGSALLLVALAFLYAGLFSTRVYTLVNQKANNTPEMVELIDYVEENFNKARIFVHSNDLFVYYDLQNRMIHSTIYPGNANTASDLNEYDLIIIPQGTPALEVALDDKFEVSLRNDKYALLRRVD